jgi:uncharacterized protein (DUF849 family)
MLQACLNGGRAKSDHAALPLTPAELAAAATTARAAGADELHIHPRGATGAETLAPEPVAACLAAIRAAVPGMPVGIGTGAWIAPGGRARLGDIRGWTARPDYASVNLNEREAPETIALLLSMGVGVEAGLWSRADAERFVTLADAPYCLRVLIEMTSDDPTEAEAEYRATRAVLDAAGLALPILLHGEGGSLWPMVARAAADGLSSRVGFEDGLALPDGSPAPDNAAMVRAAAALLARS